MRIWFWAKQGSGQKRRILADFGGNINIGSMNNPDLKENGSVDVYFGPSSPVGNEKNFIQTDPKKSFGVVFRFYGPLEGYIEKTWELNDFELIK